MKKDHNDKSSKLSRRRFLLSSIAISLNIPGCYLVKPTDPPRKKPTSNPPSTDSKNVFYYTLNDQEYQKYKQPFNKRIQAFPKLIAVCNNETGVQEAIHYARYYKLPIAVKSGGHSFEGYSVNDGGLVIELSRMHSLKYDGTTGVFTSEPGAKLGNIYHFLGQHKKILPAGSCGGVGVAGLTLGGGYGFFSRKLGLTCDSLLNVRMVDGRGQIHDTKDNPELLWGCKGGGNGNFGIVTQFTFKTHPAPKHFTSYLFKFYRLDPEKAKQLASFWFSEMQHLPESCYGSYILGHRTLTILVTDTEESPSTTLSQILTNIEAKASRTYPPKKQPLQQALKRYQGRPGPLYFKNVSAGYYQDFSDIESFFITIHEHMRQQLGMLLQINTLGGAINKPELESTASYPHRQQKFLGELQVYWDKESQTAKAVNSVKTIQNIFHQHGINKHYRNYPDIDLPNWEQAYYGDSYSRLQDLKRLFDPENMFQHPQSVREG